MLKSLGRNSFYSTISARSKSGSTRCSTQHGVSRNRKGTGLPWVSFLRSLGPDKIVHSLIQGCSGYDTLMLSVVEALSYDPKTSDVRRLGKIEQNMAQPQMSSRKEEKGASPCQHVLRSGTHS